MELPPFLLDHWMASHEFRPNPPRYNLASSTGPSWSLRDLQALGESRFAIEDVAIGYAPPDGGRELREAIAAHHGVDPDWVVVTTGASEACSILLCLASNAGGNVVLPAPAFPAFAAMARAWQLEPLFYQLQRAQNYRQTANAVLEAVNPATVLALVNTPHNPTGSVMDRAEIAALADRLAARGVPLIVDEVYHPLYFGDPQPSAADIGNVIVISDMSKALSLAGLRLGWIIDADPVRRKRMIDARSYFTISSSPINEAIAAFALRNRGAVLARLQAVASANLAQLKSVMSEAAGILSWAEPQGGTIAFPWFDDSRNCRGFCERLAENGLLIVPGDCFDRPDHFRLGFGALAGDFDQAMNILRSALRA
jgi:aspartate/methionine/tyrosine aminotransferase